MVYWCLMIFRKLAFRVFLFLMILVVSLLAVSRTTELVGWIVWRISDGNPIISEGVISKVYEYQGRDSGKQRVYFYERGNEDNEIVLHAAFGKSLVQKITGHEVELKLRYFPTPTGRKYIYFISLNNEVIYSADFQSSGWGGIAVLFICIFYYLIALVLLIILIKEIKKGS